MRKNNPTAGIVENGHTEGAASEERGKEGAQERERERGASVDGSAEQPRALWHRLS